MADEPADETILPAIVVAQSVGKGAITVAITASDTDPDKKRVCCKFPLRSDVVIYNALSFLNLLAMKYAESRTLQQSQHFSVDGTDRSVGLDGELPAEGPALGLDPRDGGGAPPAPGRDGEWDFHGVNGPATSIAVMNGPLNAAASEHDAFASGTAARPYPRECGGNRVTLSQAGATCAGPPAVREEFAIGGSRSAKPWPRLIASQPHGTPAMPSSGLGQLRGCVRCRTVARFGAAAMVDETGGRHVGAAQRADSRDQARRPSTGERPTAVAVAARRGVRGSRKAGRNWQSRPGRGRRHGRGTIAGGVFGYARGRNWVCTSLWRARFDPLRGSARENRDRPWLGCRLQHRHDLGIEEVDQRIRTAPPSRCLLL
jgi:hypothetical protein